VDPFPVSGEVKPTPIKSQTGHVVVFWDKPSSQSANHADLIVCSGVNDYGKIIPDPMIIMI
jgi:hypothetical protein